MAQLEIAILGQDWETCKAILLDPAYEDMPTDILKRSSGALVSAIVRGSVIKPIHRHGLGAFKMHQ